MEITTDQLEKLVTEAASKGAEAAIRAADHVDPTTRPGGSGTVSNVNLQRPQRPSLSRAVRAAKRGHWKGAELERDFTQAVRDVLLKDWRGDGDDEDDGDTAGMTFGWTMDATAFRSVMEKASIPAENTKFAAYRAMAESSISVSYGGAAAGGALTAPQYLPEEFVLSLQPGAIFRQIPGVDTIPVNFQTVLIPRETAKGAFSMVAEAGTLSASDPTFASQSITIRKGYAYRQYSNELLADANPALDRYLTQTVARDVALGWDLQYLEGSGSGSNITGLLNYSGTTSPTSKANLGPNGGVPTADTFKQLIYGVRAANAEPNAWVMNPRTLETVAELKDANGRYIYSDNAFSQPIMLPGQSNFTYPGYAVGSLLGRPVYLSTQISTSQTVGTSTDCSWIGLGNFNFARILERQGVEIMVSEHIAFTTDQTAIRATSRAALALTQPAAFSVLTGVRA